MRLGIKILMEQKVKADKEMAKKTVEMGKIAAGLLLRFPLEKKTSVQEQDYKVIMAEGKEKLMQIIKQQIDCAQSSIDVITTFKRWVCVVDECFENFENALKRGVKCRVILETRTVNPVLPKNTHILLSKPNFNLKLTLKPQSSISAIFDGKEATFNYYPSKSFAESPLIWTNHVSFLSMGQEHFETVWKSAKKYKADALNTSATVNFNFEPNEQAV